MTDQIRAPIKLSDEQIEQLRSTTQDGKANYPAGYDLIYRWIKDNPAAQQDGTVFWFEQARGINGDDSLSARFIRRHTENGLDIVGVPNSQRLDMQELSNLIAAGVTEDILRNKQVAALPEIVNKDISVALKDGKVELGGWGGSFYYWDMPFKTKDDKEYPRHPDGSYKTLGDEITRIGQVDLLIETSSRTVAQMQLAGELPVKEWGTALQTGLEAGIPMRYQAEIGARASGIVAEAIKDEKVEQYDKSMQQGLKDMLCAAIPSFPLCPNAGAGLDPRTPSSQDHPLYKQIESGVARIDAEKGRAPDQRSENLVMSGFADAKAAGLTSVDHVVLNQAGRKPQDDGSLTSANTLLIAIQGRDPADPAAKRAVTDVAQAVERPVEQSLQRVEALNQQQTQVLAQQQNQPTQDNPSRGPRTM